MRVWATLKRVTLWLAIGVIGLAAVLVLIVMTGFGRAWMADRIADAASAPGAELAIGQFGGTLPWEIRATDITASDDDGVWLRVPELVIDWRPSALFSGTLHVSRIAMDAIEIAREPRTDAESGAPASDDGGVPELPMRVRVDDLRVGMLSIPPSLLGTPATFSIAGQLGAAERDRVSSALSIRRTDGPGLTVDATATYFLTDSRLALSIDAADQAGGLVTAVTGLGDLPALTLTLTGDGPVSDWRGNLALDADGALSADAQFSVAHQGSTKFETAGSVQSNLDLDPALEQLLAKAVAFEIAGDWSQEQLLRLDTLSISSPAGKMAMTGTVDTATEQLALEGGIDLDDPSIVSLLAPEVSVDPLTSAFDISGPWLRPTATVAVRSGQVAVAGVALRGTTLTATLEPEQPLDAETVRIAVRASGDIDNVSGEPVEQVAGLIDGPISWRATGVVEPDAPSVALDVVAIDASPIAVDGTARFDGMSGAIDSTLNIIVATLEPLDAMLGLGLGGQFSATVDLSAEEFGDRASMRIDGTVENAEVDDQLLDSVLAGSVAFSAESDYASERGLTVDDFSVSSPTLGASGSARLSPDFTTIDGDLTLTPRDLAALASAASVDVRGDATLNLRFTGAIDDSRIEGDLALRDAAVADVAVSQLDADFQAANLLAAPAGVVSTTADTAYGALSARSDFALAPDALALNALALRTGGTEIVGDLVVPTGGAPVTGALSLDLEDLRRVLTPLQLDADARGTGRIDLIDDAGNQAVAARLNLADLIWRDQGEAVASIARMSIDGRATILPDAPRLDGTVRAESVAADTLTLESLDLALNGTTNALDFALEGAGDYRGPLSLNADGRVERTDSYDRLVLRDATGQALEQPIEARCTVTAGTVQPAYALEDCALTFGPGSISGEGRLDSAAIALDATVADFTIGSLAPFLPGAPETGLLDASIAINGPRESPIGDARLTVTDLKVESPDPTARFAASFDAAWRNRRLAVDGSVEGPIERPLTIALDLPLLLDAVSLTPSVPDRAPISGQVAWQGEVASLWPLLALDDHDLRGALVIDANLSGSLAEPRMAGALTLDDGRYEHFAAGTLLSELGVTLEFTDRSAKLSRLEAIDGNGGTVTGTADLAFDAEAKFPFESEIALRTLTALRRDEVTATIDGDLAISGTADRAALTGAIRSRSIEARIPDSLPAEIVDLDPVEVGLPEREDLATGESARAPSADAFGLDLDLGIVMPGRVFVRGRGLDSEWSGSLAVSGTAAVPIVAGTLTLVRGQLTLLTKTFRLTKGVVRLAGDPDTPPQLDIVAEHQADDVTATAEVSGDATNPTITLSSTPYLPEDEVVSRVLFGKTTTELSPLEAAQLAAAVAELSGVGGGGPGILDFTRELVGVDVLRVGGGDTGGTVEAGKYLADGVYVGVKKGLTPESDEVVVEVEVTPNISVESETGATGESDIGVKLEWDY